MFTQILLDRINMMDMMFEIIDYFVSHIYVAYMWLKIVKSLSIAT